MKAAVSFTNHLFDRLQTFQKGIRLFVKTHANQTATADDLWRSFQMAIGKVGKDEFAQFQLEVVQGIANWTRMAGYPILHVSVHFSNGCFLG